MRPLFLKIAVLAALVIGLTNQPPIVANSTLECPAIPVCQALSRSTIVFVGDVIEAGPIEHQLAPNGSRRGPQTVRFKVIEAFGGLTQDQREVTGEILETSSETDFIQSPGRYVVYARELSKGKWIRVV